MAKSAQVPAIVEQDAAAALEPVIEGTLVDPEWRMGASQTETGLVRYPALEAMEARLASMVGAPVDESRAAINAIVEQIFSADTPEEVLADSEGVGADEMRDIPLRLESVRFERSTIEAGEPFYAVMMCVDSRTGKTVVVTCGAMRVVAQIMKLVQLNALPANIVIKRSKNPTRKGYWPLRLVVA